MKRWKKIVIALLLLVTVSQIPFAYRRYKLGRLQSAINRVNSERTTNSTDDNFREYKGVIHVHSSLGGHSSGNFEEIIAGAQANNLDFVVMTEHPSRNFDTAAMTLKGIHGGVLFLNGNEVALANQDRILAVPGDAQAGEVGLLSTQEILTREKTRGALLLVAYPQEFKSWRANDYDGVEVYNLFTNSRRINPALMFFDGLWSYRSYPELLFANFYERPSENLRLWDQALAQKGKRLVATAGNDAHANVGLSVIDATGKTLLGIRLDPYQRSFHLVRMHLLLPREVELSEASLLSALKEGHCFIAFDIFGDSTGFRFSATNDNGSQPAGDEVVLSPATRLIVNTPVSTRVVLFKDGNVSQERSGAQRFEFEIVEKGIYRVEVYLPQLPKPVSEQPWIISNPIYIR
jgi:hypothetical protein